MKYGEIFEKVYKGKKVLLTGHTGFKGSWMLAWLHKLGAIIKGYSLSPENENDLYNRIKGDELCDSVIGDIRDKDKIKKLVLDFQPDFIFHLAAQALVRPSYEMPLYTFEVNVNGTAHLLEALRELEKTCCIVIVTTDKVYENKESDYAYKETDKLGGYDPYSASKAMTELLVSSYRNSFFNNKNFSDHRKAIATARAGNVIGGGDWAKDRILPDIVRALEADQMISIRNPGATRPWQHVLEPLSGYLLLGAKLNETPMEFAEAWNFGPSPDEVQTVGQLVEQVIQLFGSGRYEISTSTHQPHEAGFLKLDISKAARLLGWEPKMSMKESIEETVMAYKELFRRNHNIIYSQIEKFSFL